MTGASCTNHPDEPAAWRCSFCDVDVCDGCVTIREIREREVRVCKECGGRCARIGGEAAEPRPATPGEPAPKQISVLMLPLQGDGSVILLTGTIVLGFVSMLSMFPILGPLLALMVAFYLGTYWLEVVRFAAYDAGELPKWPEAEDGIWSNGLRVIVLILACTLPSEIWFMKGSGWTWDTDRSSPVGWLLMVAGVVYYPMGMLALAIFRDLTAVSPHIVVPAIARVGVSYLPAVGLVFGIEVLDVVLDEVVTLPVIGPFLAAGASLYLVAVAMTCVGRLYREHYEELGWEHL